jgi:hypothetical protein
MDSPAPRLHFVTSTRPCLPVGYFTTEWTRVVMRQNAITKPLGSLNNLGLSYFMNSVLE